jgi:hypothetical protein
VTISVYLAGALRFLNLIQAAADTACAESGAEYTDGACVLQVVTNRAARKWRNDGSLWGALWARAQHAHSCGFAPRVEHYRTAFDFVAGRLRVPEFCKRALWYCGRYDRAGQCEGYGGEPVGRISPRGHEFWGLKTRTPRF